MQEPLRILSPAWIAWPPLWHWQSLNLTHQYLIATTCVILVGLLVITQPLVRAIEAGIVQRAAVTSAHYLDNFIEPLVRELATGGSISHEHADELGKLMQRHIRDNRLISFNVWSNDRRIAFSTRSFSAIGMEARDDERLERAFHGEVNVHFDVSAIEHLSDQRSNARPLVEIHTPIRTSDGRIYAVAEFYENGVALMEEIAGVKRTAWQLASIVALVMMVLQYQIVRRGHRTIEQQQLALTSRLSTMTDMLAQNVELRRKVDDAWRGTHALNEEFMRRTGADLHDGPAQLIGMSILLLEPISESPFSGCDDPRGAMSADDIALARSTLIDSLNDIRQISSGLMLPRLNELSVSATLEMAVLAHTRRTRTVVDLQLKDLSFDLGPLQKATVYRVAQEGLNNAFRHADGNGQVVRAGRRGDMIEIEVIDSGTSRAKPTSRDGGSPLGLAGLADRLASLGGKLNLETSDHGGGRLIAVLPIDPGGIHA